MAERRINLNDYKASGVYTIEIDQSENLALPLTTGRLMVGSSRIGPFNTIVLINDLRTLKAVFGDIDPKLEKAGGYFHRSIEVALREGPVFALNVLPIDSDTDRSTNKDQVFFATFNTEASSSNGSSTPKQNPLVEFFNRRRLWFASDEQLNKTKNDVLSGADENKLLSFVNTGKNNVTIWTRRAATAGFDITASEWYNTVGAGNNIDFPKFVHPDDFISDYMVESIVISGDWNNYLRLSKDPIYSQFFDETGLIESKASNFFALREVKVINRTIGCLIPDFIDQSGNSISIDLLVNRSFPTTGVLCALDTDKMDEIDLIPDTTAAFNDTVMATHRVDLVGHGFDDLANAVDDGGFETDGTTSAPVTPLIDQLSYSRPADSSLVYTITSSISATGFVAGLPPTLGETYLVAESTGSADDGYIIAMKNSKLYNSYIKGFVKTNDVLKGTSNLYVKILDNLSITVGANDLPYIVVKAYSDITLNNQVNPNNYTGTGGDEHVNIITDSGELFKNTFTLSDTNYFSDYSVTQPNVITVTVEPAAGTAKRLEIDEFIKVNSYIKASTVGTVRDRYLKIISVTSEIVSGDLIYVITTMSPSASEVTGIDFTSNQIQVIKGIYNFATSLRGQYLKGFKVRNELLPNSTATRQKEILAYLFDFTSIPETLAGKEAIDFRYVVDTYEGDISSQSKSYLSKIAALHGQSMAILNAPSIKQFEESVSPSFINSTNKLVSSEFISTGGDLSLNPGFTFKFGEEDVNGVPLSSYSMFNFPNLVIRNGNRLISVPPAPYISNLYVKKFRNGTPFLIVAGGKRGVINDPQLAGVEYELSDADRAFLEPVGHNLIVRRRGFGTLLFSNNTAYQRINSALNNAHVRDNLSTIERDLARILFNFLFDFNDEITRLRIKTIVENYLDSVVQASGLSTYEVIFDSSNNGDEVLESNSAIIDVRVNFPRGIHKFINRITITRAGGQLSSESTGFTPSF